MVKFEGKKGRNIYCDSRGFKESDVCNYKRISKEGKEVVGVV